MPSVDDLAYPAILSHEYCPNCEWGPLEEGELCHETAAFKWEYCEVCGWRGDVIGYQVLHHEWGTAYKFDATLVRPDAALFKRLSGQRRADAFAIVPPPLSIASPQPVLTAPCPQCSVTIQLRQEIAQDCSFYNSYWLCELCGFRSDDTKTFAPGVFRHSEGYRWIVWRGTTYELTRNQSVIVKMLHAHYLEGRPDVRQLVLMNGLGVLSGRVRDSFRHTNHELLGKLIIHQKGSSSGTLRLKL